MSAVSLIAGGLQVLSGGVSLPSAEERPAPLRLASARLRCAGRSSAATLSSHCLAPASGAEPDSKTTYKGRATWRSHGATPWVSEPMLIKP
jgi:hypothetical protein